MNHLARDILIAILTKNEGGTRGARFRDPITARSFVADELEENVVPTLELHNDSGGKKYRVFIGRETSEFRKQTSFRKPRIGQHSSAHRQLKDRFFSFSINRITYDYRLQGEQANLHHVYRTAIMKVAPGALVDKKFPFLPIRIQGRYINFQENSQYLKNMNTMKFKQLQASRPP